ncbi:hypothetical protein SprV_0602073500 [Sparganum proliferum]
MDPRRWRFPPPPLLRSTEPPPQRGPFLQPPPSFLRPPPPPQGQAFPVLPPVDFNQPPPFSGPSDVGRSFRPIPVSLQPPLPPSSMPPACPLRFSTPPPPLCPTQPSSMPSQQPVGTEQQQQFGPSADPAIVATVYQWLSDNAAKLERAKLERCEKAKVTIPEFRALLARWDELLSSGCGDSAEARDLQARCSDPETLDTVKRRLARIDRKKRSRHARRRSESPLIVQTSVFDTLQNLAPDDFRLGEGIPSPESGNAPVAEPSDRAVDADLKKLAVTATQLRRLRTYCRTQLRILSDLQKLRAARRQQMISQGGLFPSELDDLFHAEIRSLESEVGAKLEAISDLEAKIKNCIHTKPEAPETKPKSQEDLLGFTNVPEHIIHALFGRDRADPNDRQTRFYCQANRNFSDFVRIRSGWDVFLVQDETLPDEHRLPPSQFPPPWQLPPDDRSGSDISGSTHPSAISRQEQPSSAVSN